MLVNIPDNGLVLERPTKMAGLPQQAFALTLSDSTIEDMIKRVQNGEGIQLSLGENPVSRAPLIRARVTMDLPIVLLHNSLKWGGVVLLCVSCSTTSATNSLSPLFVFLLPV